MLNFLRWLYGIKPDPPPVPGEIRYLWKDCAGPWEPGPGASKVEVLDVKDGWVRYKWLGNGCPRLDERDPVGTFNACWKRFPKD